MDHHDDWAQWHSDDPGDGDTADLGGPDLGDHNLGDEHLGDRDFTDYGEHDLGDHNLGDDDTDYGHHDLTPGPDLVHEGDDLPAHSDEPDLTGHDTDLPHDPDPPQDADVPHQSDLVDDTDQPTPTEHLVGTDPDLPADGHSGWHEGYFPPALDLDARPEPADGYPWADPDVLGDAPAGHDDAGPTSGGAAAPGDLFAYAGIQPPPAGVDPWAHLLASDDPATSTLARFWGPAAGTAAVRRRRARSAPRTAPPREPPRRWCRGRRVPDTRPGHRTTPPVAVPPVAVPPVAVPPVAVPPVAA